MDEAKKYRSPGEDVRAVTNVERLIPNDESRPRCRRPGFVFGVARLPRGSAAVAGERLRLPARLRPILAMFTATFVAIAATFHPVAPVLHGISLMTQSVTPPVESRRGPFVFLGGLRMSVLLEMVSFLL